MKPLYSNTEFNNAKSSDLLPYKCYHCGKTYYRTKHSVQRVSNLVKYKAVKYCSKKCQLSSLSTSITCVCDNCGKTINKTPSQIKKSKSGKHFCSRSCAATYNNVHKKHGTRKSKLEVWLESRLTETYPNLEIHFNRKDAINSELDIYIPSLKLAFELNGIYHYEPIYGDDKLEQIQNNDNRKFQACLEQGIELCIIDTSQQKYFKERTSQKYFEIIRSLINENVPV